MTSTTSPIPILLLKTRSQPSDNYATFFESFSTSSPSASTSTPDQDSSTSTPLFHPTFIPVLRHQFNHHPLLAAFRPAPYGTFLPTYGAAIFTSQRAVEALDHALTQLSSSGPGPTTTIKSDLETYYANHHALPPFYTVGPATSAALQRVADTHLNPASRGATPYPVLGAHTGNGAALAQYILETYDPPPAYADADADEAGDAGAAGPTRPRRPVLFFVGEQRRDIIPKTLMSPSLAAARRVRVDEEVVYETAVEDGFEAAFGATLGACAEGGSARVWVVVFSPAGCEAMLRVLGWTSERGWPEGARGKGGRRRVYVATIGPTTREVLWEGFGFEADVCAGRPSAEGVAEGIEEFMRTESESEGVR